MTTEVSQKLGEKPPRREKNTFLSWKIFSFSRFGNGKKATKGNRENWKRRQKQSKMTSLASYKLQLTIGFMIINYIRGSPEKDNGVVNRSFSRDLVEFVKPRPGDGKMNAEIGASRGRHAMKTNL